MQFIGQDLRFASRQLLRAPGFTATALLTLMLAIGATTAMMAVLRATLLYPLPYAHPAQLLRITDENLRGFKANGIMTVARVNDLAALMRDRHPVLSAVSFFYVDDTAVTLAGQQAVAVSGAAVSGNFFNTVGMSPLLGRTLTPADDQTNAPPVLVISHRLWSSAFASDPAVLGRTVRLGAATASIVGVMPATFDLPGGTDVWRAAHISAASFQGYRGDGSRFLNVIGRMDARETLQSVAQEGTVLAARLARVFPGTDAAWGFRFMSLRDSLFGEYRQALLLIASAVALVLLATAINLAGLQLSRNAARRQEFAVRTALGISRARLVRQLLTESVLLVSLGGLLGFGAGTVLLRVLAHRLPVALVRVTPPHVDGLVLGVCCAVIALVGVSTGLLPAFSSATGSLADGRALVRSARSFGRSFAVAQIALALVLLTLSATVLQGLYHLLNLRLGFAAQQLATCSLDLPWGTDQQRLHRFYEQAESAIGQLPGISSAGAISALPLTDFSVRRTFDIAGQPPTARRDAVVAEGRSITPGYVSAMQIPLLAGRELAAGDADGFGTASVLVNQALAARYFAKRNPVGARLVWSAGVNAQPAFSEIVGVIGNVQGVGGDLAGATQPEVYAPENGGWPHMQFAIRSTLPASTLEPEVKQLVQRLDGSATVGHFATLTQVLDQHYTQPRWNAGLLVAFATVALVLVMLGVYGLVAFDVAHRTREVGLRLALGSTREGVLLLLLSGTWRVLVPGLAVGVAASWLALRVLGAMLTFGDPAHVLPLLLPTAVLLSASVLTATLLPAWRATQIDPVEALRTE